MKILVGVTLLYLLICLVRAALREDRAQDHRSWNDKYGGP